MAVIARGCCTYVVSAVCHVTQRSRRSTGRSFRHISFASLGRPSQGGCTSTSNTTKSMWFTHVTTAKQRMCGVDRKMDETELHNKTSTLTGFADIISNKPNYYYNVIRSIQH